MKATTYVSLLLFAGLAFAQASLEVIDLRHRTAEQVLPVLRPLLEPGGVLTGQRSQLIVRTSAANLAELRRALHSLDRPARRLAISVRFDGDASAAETPVAVDARVSNRGVGVDLRATTRRSVAAERVDQRVQVMEGGRAHISAGGSRPLRMREAVVIQDIATGFEVVPRLAGDTVFLEIAPQRASAGAAPGTVQALRSAGTVSARLGEWVELAGVQRNVGQSQRIWVRVDEVRP